jgi:hypothetical protein
MRLQRLTSSYMHAHHADSDAYTVSGDSDEEQTASTHFGSERFSDFRVSLEWSDVEALIRAFSEKGHVEAARMERARMLAMAVEEIAKNSNWDTT